MMSVLYNKMGIKKDFILLGSYFLILSTVLESEDAFVFYYDSEYQPQSQTIKNNRLRMLVALAIFTGLNYLTLVIAPYLKFTIKKLCIGACGIILLKYVCELAYYMKILSFVFQLAAIFSDIIGQGLFYLTTIRMIQIINEKHQNQQKAGLAYGLFIGLYALSILFGYALGYIFFEKTPTWLFLIALTSFTISAACLAYCTFMFQQSPQRPAQLNQQQSNPQNNPNPQNQIEDNPEVKFRLFRTGINLGHVFKFTGITYTQTFPLLGIQNLLGFLIAYGYQLLQYLIWTSQTESIELKLKHNMDVMAIYGAGAVVASVALGFISDKLNTRKLGYGVLAYNAFSITFLYFAIYIKFFYTTFLLYMFLGMAQFAMLTWIVIACSKIYGGTLQVFAVNAQWIALSASSYYIGVIFFENRLNPQTKLSLELTGMIIANIIIFFFLRRLPDQRVSIDYPMQDPATENNAQVRNQPREPVEIQPRETPVQIQMVNQRNKIQKDLNNGQTIDPYALL